MRLKVMREPESSIAEPVAERVLERVGTDDGCW